MYWQQELSDKPGRQISSAHMYGYEFNMGIDRSMSSIVDRTQLLVTAWRPLQAVGEAFDLVVSYSLFEELRGEQANQHP